MTPVQRPSRRAFLQASALAAASLALPTPELFPADLPKLNLPSGNAPKPVPFPHFPSRLHAFVWRNWQLVPLARIARTIEAAPSDVAALATSMGLPTAYKISSSQIRRSYITVIRRNWHLLPYEQLLTLLDWTPEKMEYTLREDDFLYIKLGSHKPKCAPLRFEAPAVEMSSSAQRISEIVKRNFPRGLEKQEEPLFGFLKELESGAAPAKSGASRFSPKFCYSYFALYGDPLLEAVADPYPEGYLRKLAATGVDGVWLQAVLSKLAPFPWDAKLSERHEERLKNLASLVRKASKHGVGVYLYLNEPRSMPLSFFKSHPELKGVVEGDHAALCTEAPEVQSWIKESIGRICHAVPELAGFFTITGSENLTNCWSHNGGKSCPRCSLRKPGEVIGDLNRIFHEGISRGHKTQLLAWDWGWADDWAPEIIQRLPKEASLMSVSEWSLPINRGGVQTTVGEYSISSVGPGPRAKKHWKLAKARGLRTIAKIQANNSWELSAVPYIPAVANVAGHAANLLKEDVDGLMLGWTLGGYPSPNLEVIAELSRRDAGAPGGAEEALARVAEKKFGNRIGPAVVQAWQTWSKSFSEFPYHGGVVYNAPLQMGPANLLWSQATGYAATMVGIPYDSLDSWRAVYPATIFIQQLEKVAEGFFSGIQALKETAQTARVSAEERQRLEQELRVAEAAALHFRSTANQSRFILARQQVAKARTGEEASAPLKTLEEVLRTEIEDAKRLHQIQSVDSRIGFEATNQYYYVPLDLVEKVLNCSDLLDDWLPAERKKWNV